MVLGWFGVVLRGRRALLPFLAALTQRVVQSSEKDQNPFLGIQNHVTPPSRYPVQPLVTCRESLWPFLHLPSPHCLQNVAG